MLQIANDGSPIRKLRSQIKWIGIIDNRNLDFIDLCDYWQVALISSHPHYYGAIITTPRSFFGETQKISVNLIVFS